MWVAVAARSSAQISTSALRSTVRVCPNPVCVAFGRIVYSVATRCPLCRWDLKNALAASETAAQPKPGRQVLSER
jgi:hypothetical protein